MLATTTAPTTLDRYRGCLLGGAVGDALGAAVEFDDISAIKHRFGPDGITEPAEAYGRVGAITDDTQMTLFTAEALLLADEGVREGGIRPELSLYHGYQRWLRTQRVTPHGAVTPQALEEGELHRLPALQARRAPGNTCISALARGLDLERGRFRTINDSKGCGGVMRAAPCGLVTGWRGRDSFDLGVASAALTHGHPSGHLAAGALAVIIRAICDGRPLQDAVDEALVVLRRADGSHEVVASLELARRRAAATEKRPEVSSHGQGWVAEEALGIAVYCSLVHADDFAAAVRLAANHSGDSDSTAAVTGNIVGALLGAQAIPENWLAVVELRDTIEGLADAMHDRFAAGRQRPERRPAAPTPRGDGAPRHDAYWVEPGRLLAGPYAGAKAGVEAKAKLEYFLDLGVTCFIDLTEEGEGQLEPYAPLLRRVAEQRGTEVTHLRMPIRDVDVCPTWRMRAIQDAISRAIDAGEVVYVHCWGGVGRTGTVVGCRLVERSGCTGDEALRTLKRLRAGTQRAHRISPETSAQRGVVREWAAA